MGRTLLRRLHRARRASVSIMFALCGIPFLMGIATAIDFSRIAACRAVLQAAADNAALSGAAAYSINAAAFNTLAIQTATSAFCGATASFPVGAKLTSNGIQSCGSAPGPIVGAFTAGFVPGTPGLANVACAAGTLPSPPYECGFVVYVSATASFTPMLPLFSWSISLTVQSMAANPFLNIGKIFSLPNGISTGAKYANSVWAYPLLLNNTGGIDYSANAGALPDTSLCNGGPDQVNCGAYVMLGSAMYAGMGPGYTPPNQNVTYDNGVVRNPQSPVAITATTPLGIAFESIAGGNYVQHTPPGVYGYQVSNLGSPAPQYVSAPNGCIYPYYSLAYHTVGQVWSTGLFNSNGTIVTVYNQVLPWTLVSHWFYSSYLTRNLPPSESEILAQGSGAQDIPSVTNDPAQAGGNIAGQLTYTATPMPPVPKTCPSTSTKQGVTTTNDAFVTTSYFTSGTSNCSLYITTSSAPGYVPPNSSYTGSCFNPASTPGQQYAAMNCQQYGDLYYTFYWNDMGGAAKDDDNYADGIVQLSCHAQAHVMLIQ